MTDPETGFPTERNGFRDVSETERFLFELSRADLLALGERWPEPKWQQGQIQPVTCENESNLSPFKPEVGDRYICLLIDRSIHLQYWAVS